MLFLVTEYVNRLKEHLAATGASQEEVDAFDASVKSSGKYIAGFMKGDFYVGESVNETEDGFGM